MKHILLFSAPLSSVTAFAQLPTNGLAGKYSFTGNANDESGNSLHGTVMGAILTEARFGVPNSAYSFNGIDNYIILPNTNLINLNSYSYSLWVKPMSINNYSGVMYSLGSTTGNRDQMVTFDNLARFAAGSYNVGSAMPFQSKAVSGTIIPGSWQHIVVTRDSLSIKMYLNGNLLPADADYATNNQPADYGIDSRVIIGGRSHLGSDSYFNGAIDDLHHYNRILTQGEITDIYKASNVNSSANPLETNKLGLSVFPTSGNGNFTIKINNAANSELTIQIINSIGQLVYTGRYFAQNDEYIESLNLADFASGVYFIKAGHNTQSVTSKLIIQNNLIDQTEEAARIEQPLSICCNAHFYSYYR